jgi:hypothetical protein
VMLPEPNAPDYWVVREIEVFRVAHSGVRLKSR